MVNAQAHRPTAARDGIARNKPTEVALAREVESTHHDVDPRIHVLQDKGQGKLYWPYCKHKSFYAGKIQNGYRDPFTLDTGRDVSGRTWDAILAKLNLRVDEIRDQAVGEQHQFNALKEPRVM